MRSNLTGTTNRALRQNCAAIVCGPSLTFRVLCLGLLQDGDVGVGVFPEREEVLINASFRRKDLTGFRDTGVDSPGSCLVGVVT